MHTNECRDAYSDEPSEDLEDELWRERQHVVEAEEGDPCDVA